jgi:Invasion associated locus B (IalB) protein.
MTTKTGALAIGLAVGALMALAPATQAQQATELGTFNAWTAWSAKDATGQICFVSSQPQKSEPTGVTRSPINFLVVHRKDLGVSNEVQVQYGYPLHNSNPNVSVSVDGKSYQLVAVGEGGWLARQEQEPEFVASMKAGNQMVVRGTSQRGTNTVDTYSLSGATAAMNAIDAACQ